MIPELALTITVLVLFGIQQPGVSRALFWRIGYDHRLNSNPNIILYAYANHRPLPKIPLVWSQDLINYNVAISIVSLFFLLGKMIATIMKVYFPLFGVIANICLCALYAVSVYGQGGPDYLDSRYPSPSPWYLRHSCDMAAPYRAVKNCHIVKASFAITVIFLAFYFFNLCFALWAMWPNKELDRIYDEDEEEYGRSGSPSPSGDYALRHQEKRPAALSAPATTPFTPRTQAFHALDRKLPLRN